MKKFFALVLALAMVMSMAATSFAAVVAGPFDYDSDNDRIRNNGIQYGDSVYFLLAEEAYAVNVKNEYVDWANDEIITDGNTPAGYQTVLVPAAAMTDYAQVEKLKLKVSYELGEDMVESVSIVKKYVDEFGDKNTDGTYKTGSYVGSDVEALMDGAGYYYFIALKVKKSTSVSDVDVIGTFELNRKENDDKGIVEIDEQEIDFAVNVAINNGWLKDPTNFTIKDDKEHLKWDTDYALKFDYDDEVELSFGTEDNEGTFTVDVSGQGKVYLRYDTKLADAIAEANPGVKIFAVNFNGVKFNRVGEFAYEMEDGVACYKVVDGALVAIPGAEYDDSDETFYFNTRVLENYVFASAELVNPVVEAPVVEAPVATNPSTGA